MYREGNGEPSDKDLERNAFLWGGAKDVGAASAEKELRPYDKVVIQKELANGPFD